MKRLGLRAEPFLPGAARAQRRADREPLARVRPASRGSRPCPSRCATPSATCCGRPGFTALAAGTLALGIAASTAIFSLADAVVLAPLPYEDPASRVMIWNRWRGFDKTWVNPAEMRAYGERCPSLAAVANWGIDRANLTGDGEAARVGVALDLGERLRGARLAAAARAAASRPRRTGRRARSVAVLGHALWQGRFGGEPGVLGRLVELDGVPHEVVGVMPPGFALPTDFTEDAAEPTQIYVPRAPDADDLTQFGNHGDYGAAAARPGRERRRARARSCARRRASSPRKASYDTRADHSAFAVSLPDEILGPHRPAVAVTAAAAILLLLIACSNVASLLLARGAGRQRELALRAAVGGGRGRLSASSSSRACCSRSPERSWACRSRRATLRLLGATVTANVPRAGAASIDPRAVAFALGLAAADDAGLRARAGAPGAEARPHGSAPRGRPALGRRRVAPALAPRRRGRAGGLRGAAGGGRGPDGAGASAPSRSIDLGFEPKGVLTQRLSLPAERLPGGAGRDPLLPRAARRDARPAGRQERRPAALAAARRVDRRLGHRRRGLRRAGARLGPGRLAGGLRRRRRDARRAARERTPARAARTTRTHPTWP